MRAVKSISKLFFLITILFVSSICGAIAENYDKTVITEIVIDGQKYANTVQFHWCTEYTIPEGSIEWDGDPEYIYMPAFDNESLLELPVEDPASDVADYYVKNNISFTASIGSDFYSVQQLAAKYGFRIIGFLAPTRDYLIQSVNDMSYAELQASINVLREHEVIDSEAITLEYVEVCTPNNYYPNDPWGNDEWNTNFPSGNNWSVEAIKAPIAWMYNKNMSELPIGILDGFVSPTHEDFNIEIVMDPYKDWWEIFGAYSGGAFTSFSHGTHVSGTFAGRFNNNTGVSGVFPHGKIVAGCFDYLTDEGDAIKTTNTLTKYYLLKMRAYDVKVINMSYGLSIRKREDYSRILSDPVYRDALFEQFVDYYNSQGWRQFFASLETLNDWDFLFIHSAGNDKTDAELNGWPEAVQQFSDYFRERLIVVGSFGKADWEDSSPRYVYSAFSNFGNIVKITAPGEHIYSSVIGYPPFRDSWYQSEIFSSMGDTSYWNGTSQAAPHVAGTAAMIWSLAPDTLTGPRVKEILLKNANYADALTSGHSDDTVNGVFRRYPLLDAGKAVTAAVEYLALITPAPTNTPTPTPTAAPTKAPIVTATPSPVVTITPTSMPSVAPSTTLSCTLSVSIVDYMTTYTLQCSNVQGEITSFDVSVSNKNILLLDTAQGLVYDSTIITDDAIIFQLDDELINGAIMTVTATDSSGQTFNGAMCLAAAMDGSYQVPSVE